MDDDRNVETSVSPVAAGAKATAKQGVGARLLRKEDDRLMRGRGQFVADIRLAGLQDVAFVRSPLAHARIRSIDVPDRFRGAVFTAADLSGVKPIRAVSGLPGFKISEQPVLSTGKVRHVGELVAMCVAPTRAEAEDIAASVTLDFDELPAIHDMLQAREADAALVHEHWGDNVFLESAFEVNIAVRRADQGHARNIHRTAMHVPARRARRGRDLRSSA
jgi:aerobic carbon-monoxide dehydrogenase large subunit